MKKGSVLYHPNFPQTKLDEYFKALENNNKFMGSVAVSKQGEIIYLKSTGFSDTENNLKANKNSKYRIGSISKTFTSVLILKAVEEKKLTLNQSIDKFFPSVKNADKITVKHLLNHRSGIFNFTSNSDYFTWNTQPKTEKEIVEIISRSDCEFEPDSKTKYSNSNFVLLTYILEKEYQKSYSELLQEHIIHPLRLQNTIYGRKIFPNKNECKSYHFNGNWELEPETDMCIPLGAGGIVSTPSDLTRFSDSLFGGKLLNDKNLELMKIIIDGYGIGLIQVPFYDKIGFGHTGSIDGFRSAFFYFKDGDISYALTSNATNYENNEISIAVLSAVYSKPFNIPEFYKVSFTDLDKYLGEYSSKEFPLKVTITKDRQTLIAQATGQSSFLLEATDEDKFKYDLAGVVLEFIPTKKTMILKQSKKQYTFTKE